MNVLIRRVMKVERQEHKEDREGGTSLNCFLGVGNQVAPGPL